MNDRRPDGEPQSGRVNVVPAPDTEGESQTGRVTVASAPTTGAETQTGRVTVAPAPTTGAGTRASRVVASPVPEEEPSLGDLVMGLTDDLTTLVRKEVELAKAELTESVKDGARAGAMVAAGGLVAYAGLILVLIGLSVALGAWMDNLWLATLLVGIVTLLVGYLLFNSGKNQLQDVSLVPRKTLSSINSDAKMAKEKLS